MCCANIDSGTDLLGAASTVIVAFIALCSGVIIAKLNSNLEIEKTLCLRKVETFEKAILQLDRLINLYMTEIASLNHVWDMATLKGEVAVLAANIGQSAQIPQSDDDRLRVMFYVRLPSHNACPIIQETPSFLQMLNELIAQIKAGEPILESQLNSFNEVRARYLPLLGEEYEYIVKVRQIVEEAILNDKQMRKLLSNPQYATRSLIECLTDWVRNHFKGGCQYECDMSDPNRNPDSGSRRAINER